PAGATRDQRDAHDEPGRRPARIFAPRPPARDAGGGADGAAGGRRGRRTARRRRGPAPGHPRRGAHRRLRRPDAPAPGVAQPDRQRDQLFARPRPGADRDRLGPGDRRIFRARQWRGLRDEVRRAPVRRVRAAAQRERVRGHRHRPRDRAAHRQPARRHGARRWPPRPRRHLPLYPPRTLVPAGITAARLAFAADGTPFSETFGDVYHSAEGGLAQARHVFLAGNGLPERWRGRDLFTVLETGFGLGLSFLATWNAWRDDSARCRRLHFVSIEKHPFAAGDLAFLWEKYPELKKESRELIALWPMLVPGVHRMEFEGGKVVLTLFMGDIADGLPQLQLAADAIYLDGFAPQKNPQMWEPALLRHLGRLAAPGATLATWSVASSVRSSLEGAGFAVE